MQTELSPLFFQASATAAGSIQTDIAGNVMSHNTGAIITASQIAVEQIGAP